MSITEGIININKPTGWTSHDCVALMRNVLGTKRVGHTGTLDPMATGVLPVCIGSSTRIMEYLDLDLKTYRCEMQLGIETDTLDIWGKTICTCDTSRVTEEAVRKAFRPFHGTISQIPPKYSAVKVNGKKLYQYARAGEEVEIKPRKVWIGHLSITDINLRKQRVSFIVTCSKGTYIRSICRDVGETLGCGAAMSALTRTASGIFTLENAVELESLRNMDWEQIRPLVLSTDHPLVHFGKILLSKEQGHYFCNGKHISMDDVMIEKKPGYGKEADCPAVPLKYEKAYNVYAGHRFLGVAIVHGSTLVPDKVFFRGRI